MVREKWTVEFEVEKDDRYPDEEFVIWNPDSDKIGFRVKEEGLFAGDMDMLLWKVIKKEPCEG